MAGWHCSEGIARAPWRPIDPSVLTPIHQFSKTLPCLFPPSSGVAAIKRNVKKQRNQIYREFILKGISRPLSINLLNGYSQETEIWIDMLFASLRRRRRNYLNQMSLPCLSQVQASQAL